MTFPLQITYRNMPPSQGLENRIRELAKRLERFASRIVRCVVVVQRPHQSSQTGNPFDVHVNVVVPGTIIAVHRAHAHDDSHADPYVALRDAFTATRRRLQDYERIRRHAVKTHDSDAIRGLDETPLPQFEAGERNQT